MRLTCNVAAWLIALVCVTAAVPAQDADRAAPVDAIRVQNLAPLERAGWVTAPIPLEGRQLEGEWIVHTQPRTWAVLGARSALKARLLHVFVPKIGPHETTSIRYWLEDTLDKPDDADTGATSGTSPPALLELAAERFDPPSLLVRIAGEEILTSLGHGLEVVEQAGRIVVRTRTRIPGTMLVAEAWWYLYPEARSIPWELFVICSDSQTRAMRQDIESLELRMPRSLVPVVRNAVALGASQPRLEGGTWSVALMGPTHFADAQGQAWSGVLLRPDGATPIEARSLAAELHGPLVAMAKPDVWERSGAWGPWGVLPTAHPAAERTFDAAIRRHQRWLAWASIPRDPWDAMWQQVKRPAQTGDQYDFGVTKLAPALAAKGGAPLHLDEAFTRAMTTARRRGYYREPSGAPVLQVNHPDLTFWGQEIHFHDDVSSDRLGKDPWVQQPFSHGWTGWDREHISLNGLCGAYMLTGSHLLRELVRSNIESWLLGATTKPGWSTTGRGAPRSVGRTLLAMAWSYLCTGDARIVDRMRARLDSSYADLLGTEAELVVLGVHGKDGRKLGGLHPFWMPWQEAMGVAGLDAAYQVTGDARFLALAKDVARTLIQWGWWERSPGDWTVGDAIAVLEPGRPLPASAYSDPALTKDHSGTDFDLWALPAVKLALRYAQEDHDEELAHRCQSILECLRARRRNRTGEAFDRYGEWAAVR